MTSSLQKFKTKLYDKTLSRTLSFYETWVLPKSSSRKSLREVKMEEFRERKKLLNPYERPLLLDSASQEERIRLDQLDKQTSFSSMHDFTVTYDRHESLYGYRTHTFPSSYKVGESPLNYAMDPDWSIKMQ